MSTAPPIPVNRSRSIFVHAGWIALIAILYGALFFIPLPQQFKRQGIFLTDELILLVLLALVFFTFRQPGRGAKYVRLGLILVAFTLPLLRLWETAESSWNIILGLLPWADATEYYFDVNRLLQGGLFSAFSGRRPMFASLVAVILTLSHQSLQITLVIFTIINALVVFLLVEEIHSALGPVAAIVALYLSQFFYRPFAGTTLTEQLGYPLGMLALIVLMRAVKSSKAWLFALGLLLLTYSLLVRAGAFFILPVLIVFAVFHFGRDKGGFVKTALLMLAAVILPILSNTWLGRTVASPGAVAFANFADTLYGQARGGVRWTQAAVDHPELAGMTEPARSQLLYHLTFEEMKRNPLGLVRGSLKAWTDFLRPGPWGAFGFLTLGNRGIDFIVQVAAALLFLAGVWLLWKNRKQPLAQLILVFWIGIFLSIPFLPPIDAGIRPYAATAALLFLPVCFVLSPAAFKGSAVPGEHRTLPIGVFSSGLALALVVIALLGAPLLKLFVRPVQVQPAICAADRTPISFRLNPGSFILFSSTTDGPKTKVPIVRLEEVRRSFDDFPYSEFAVLMRKIKQPALLAVTSDVSTGQGMWIVAPAELNIQENQIISACAKLEFATYPVMYVESLGN
jgi:hypothetical protein